MKRIFFSMLLLGSAVVTFAQDRDRDRDRDDRDRNYRDERNYNARGDVPSNVWNSFHNTYPNSREERWERSGRNWHVYYTDPNYNNRPVDLYYDRRGRLIDTHTYWDYNNLPSDFNERIHNRYHIRDNNYKVYRIERRNGEPVFQIMLNDGSNRTFYADQYGNPIRYRDRH
jgi:hypothetical protein